MKMTDEQLVDYVLTAYKRAKTFRDSFTEDVDKSVQQYNCEHPSEWADKKDWQTKVFIPMQYKDVEVGASMLIKMLLSQKEFFEIDGFESEEEDLREALKEFIVHLLQKGNFYNVGALGIKESCITSTCFIKTQDVSEGKNDFTLKFIPRTFYDVLIDPSVSFYWIDARFILDEYERDISEVISNDLYKYGEKSFEALKEEDGKDRSGYASDKYRKILENINQSSSDSTYKPVHIIEFHGKVKDPETQEDVEMVLTVANEKYLIRKTEVEEEDRPYDVIRVNPIPKQFYGMGLCRNKHDLQDLMNGVVNLWMDSWKLSSMKMVGVDPDGNVKWDTIKYEPTAIWELKKDAMFPVEFSTPVDGINAMTIIDQVAQETTGITKISQGQNVPGSDETLGEVQIKLSRSDTRFLQMAKFIEAEWLGRFIKKVINYTIKHCPQSYVNKIMGLKKEKRLVPGQDPVTGELIEQEVEFKVPRLDLEFVRKNKEIPLDFKPIGISRFMDKADEQARYKELLQGVLTNETMASVFDVKKVIKRTMQSAGFEDVDDLMKSEEEQQGGVGGRPPDFPVAPTEQEIITPELGVQQ